MRNSNPGNASGWWHRAKTNGNVERRSGCLRHNLWVWLVSTLKQERLTADCGLRNERRRLWLSDVTYVHVHRTTKRVSGEVLLEERPRLIWMALGWSRWDCLPIAGLWVSVVGRRAGAWL